MYCSIVVQQYSIILTNCNSFLLYVPIANQIHVFIINDQRFSKKGNMLKSKSNLIDGIKVLFHVMCNNLFLY